MTEEQLEKANSLKAEKRIIEQDLKVFKDSGGFADHLYFRSVPAEVTESYRVAGVSALSDRLTAIDKEFQEI